MKKKNIVIANWKMNPSSIKEAKDIFNFTKKTASTLKNTEVLIFPPSIYIESLIKLKKPKNLHVGCQDFHYEDKGAFTGQISLAMLKDIGVRYVLVGHSEVRRLDNNEVVSKKLGKAFDSGFYPVLCIGESMRDSEGSHLTFLKNQIKESIGNLQKKYLIGLAIAYEPVWAIGKSYKEAMDPTDIHETVLFIKKSVGEIFGRDVADSIRVLYGAAVEAPNARAIIDYGNVGGFIVGHASLKKDEFPEILKSVDKKNNYL